MMTTNSQHQTVSIQPHPTYLIWRAYLVLQQHQILSNLETMATQWLGLGLS